MNTPDPGPDPNVFKHLAGRLAGFSKEATGSKIITPGVKVPCQICGKHFGGAFKVNTAHHCRACRKALEDGWTCFRTLTGRHQFLKHEKMPAEWAGTVRPPITDTQMDEMEKRFKELKAQSNGGQSPNLN